MNRILILFMFLTLFATTQAEEIWQRLEQPTVNADLGDLFHINEKAYVWLSDGLFEFKDGEYFYVEEPFYQDKGRVYSLNIRGNKGVMSTDSGTYYINNYKWTKYEEMNDKIQLEDILFMGNRIIGYNSKTLKVLYSNDYGKSWESVTNELDTLKAKNLFYYNDTIHCTLSNRYIKIYEEGDSLSFQTSIIKKAYSFNSIMVDDTVVYLGDYSNGLFKSTNYGESWENYYLDHRVNSIVKLGDFVYLGTEYAGVALYEEGEQFTTNKNKGLPNTVVVDLYLLNGYVYAHTWQGLYRTNNEMDGWENASYQSNVYTCFDLIADNNQLFTAIYNNAIKTSTDKGKIWSDINDYLLEDKASFWRLRVKDNIMVTYSYNGGITQFSDDYGKNWEIKAFPGNSYNLSYLKDLTISNGRILISMATGTYYTDDLGENWSKVDDINIGESIRGALKYNYIDSKLYLGTLDNGLFYSENNGTNWNKFDFGDTVLNRLKIRAIKKYGDEFYIGTQDTGLLKWNSTTKEVVWFSDSLSAHGWIDDIYKLDDNIIVKTISSIFFSKDNGKNWENVFPSLEVTTNNLQLIDDTFYIGTWRGIFYSTFDKLGIVLTSVEAEPSVNLTTAYPQPANDQLRIELDNSAMKYKILSTEDIMIYDANGRQLANQDITIEENKELIWHCKDVQPGVYFVSVVGKTIKVIKN